MTRTCELVKDKIGRWEPRRKTVTRRLCHIKNTNKKKEGINLLICSVCLFRGSFRSSWFTHPWLLYPHTHYNKWVYNNAASMTVQHTFKHKIFPPTSSLQGGYTEVCAHLWTWLLLHNHICWEWCVNTTGIRSCEVKRSSVILQQRSATDIRSDLCKSLLLCVCVSSVNLCLSMCMSAFVWFWVPVWVRQEMARLWLDIWL